MQKKFITLIVITCVLFSMCTIMVSAKESYTPIAEGIYNGHTYKVFDEKISWETAQEYCESMGGHLAAITSKEENDYIMSLLPESSGFIIGMHRDYTGYEEWVTGEAVDYSNWAPGQPDNMGNHQPSCIICNYYDRGYGIEPYMWDDGNDNTYGFIMELDEVDSAVEQREKGIFSGHTYKVFKQKLTPVEAKKYCEELGGYLVTLNSKEENDFVNELVSKAKVSDYTIGATDINEEGKWEWMTGESWDYTNWDSPTEPNNGLGRGENYAYAATSKNWKWIDYFGDYDNFQSKHPFICEWNYMQTSFGSAVSEWASKEIEVAYDKSLIPESLVGEDLTKPITRAEFAAVSVKAYEAMANTKALPAVNNPFKDTKDVEVLKAYNTGITTGVSATEFAPNELLNREQAATMLTRVFKRATMKNWTIETDSQFKLDYKKPAIFADDSRISEWAKDSVYFMAANEIINGVGGNKFAPQNTTTEEEATGYANATREQALIIATRMVENLK